jgi:hypothetical protein
MSHHSISHPVLVGDRHYLRALRAAEMAAWEAGVSGSPHIGRKNGC